MWLASCGECFCGLRFRQPSLGVGGRQGDASPGQGRIRSSSVAWLDALRPVRRPITTSLGTIFRNAANLLMTPTPRRMRRAFPIVQYHEPLTSPLLQAEIARKLTLSWNDPPLDPSWTTPDPTLTGKIESAQGMLTERFAFCQTTPLDEFVEVAEALRTRVSSHPVPSLRRGQNPPGGCGLGPRWASLARGSPSDRRRDSPNRRAGPEGGISSGRCRRILAAGGEEGKPTSRFAALWAPDRTRRRRRNGPGVIRRRTHEGPDNSKRPGCSPGVACMAAIE